MPKKKQGKKKSTDSPAGDAAEEPSVEETLDDTGDTAPEAEPEEETPAPAAAEPSPPPQPQIIIEAPVVKTPDPPKTPNAPPPSATKAVTNPVTPASVSTPKSFATPAPGRGLNKVWEEIPTVSTDKVNALMLSASAHKWEVVVTIHEPGKPMLSTLSSRVPPKQARLVMTELRTRMRPSINGEDAPTLDAVLVAGMRELAALEEEDMADLAFPPSGLASKEAVVEVVCHTEFKTQVTYRIKGALSDLQSIALCSAMRRLNNLQKSAVSPHDPVSSTLAAAVIAGLLTWDRDL